MKKYLVQPVGDVSFLLAARIADKLVSYAIAVLPFAVVFWICRGNFRAAVWLGRVRGADLTGSLLIEAGWVVITTVAWRRGTRRSVACGG